ncbi:MAG: PAS domain S-box protein [Armatimonadetes bacterium]|nr:PAS domain S-box protein [Armatimonadota bacterium]
MIGNDDLGLLGPDHEDLKSQLLWSQVTLSSIGDGVITSDADANVTYLNSVAEQLTGWSLAEAVGQPLVKVFDIINEETRKTVENPAIRALRDGVVVGLANHTMLISKDGTERPVGDSAAPIRNPEGDVAGVVLVFRDVSKDHKQKLMIQGALDYASNILETQREPFLVLDADLRVVTGNRSFYSTFGVSKEATEGVFVYELGNSQWDIPKLRELLEEILPQNHSFDAFEVEHDFDTIGIKTMLLNARKVTKPGNSSELILLAIEDVTDKKRAKALLRAQQNVIELASSGATLLEVLQVLSDAAQRHSGEQSRSAIFLCDEDGKHLKFAVATGMSAEYTSAVNLFEIGNHTTPCGQSAFTGHPVIFNNVQLDPQWKPFLDLADLHDIGAVWSVPLKTLTGAVLGTFTIYSRTPREPGDGEIEAIKLLGQTGALAIERSREAARQSAVEEALRESETRYRRLFQTAKDGILILDANSGKITDANDFMAHLVGLTREDLLGKELFEIGMFSDIEENREAFRTLQKDKYLRHDNLPVKNSRGEKVEVEFIANVYEEGDRLVAQCNVRDIRERRRLEQQIVHQTEALAEESKRKDEFLAMLSHELRNPLAPIRSSLDFLIQNAQEGEDPMRAKAREIIERQVDNLTKLVSDLMEVSRVVSGRIRLNLERINLKSVVEHAVQATAPTYEQRKHTVWVNLGPDSLWVQGDAMRLEMVVVNLLNNACKFTPDGGRIEVVCEQHEGNAQIRIRDNGIGIDAKLLPRIFDLFTQSEQSLARSEGGLGIGLNLAHRLVGMHDGTIEAKSSGRDKGSEFTITLPMAVALSEEEAGAASSDAGKIRVLLVDDNVDLVTMLSLMLQNKGFAVKFAYDGEKGLALAQTWKPNVVLLDIGLPGMDGYEVARRLRTDATLTRTKLIALTGYGRDTDIVLAFEAGFNAHLTKPYKFEILEGMIAGYEFD